MSKQSAGLLVYRSSKNGYEVLLVHPGGPFWAKKDSWSIPKGELGEGEGHIATAYREFEEETGLQPPTGPPLELGSAKQNSDKINYVWAVAGDLDVSSIKSNTFTMEWPPKSGIQQEFSEVDRAAWFDLVTAKRKLFQAQSVFIDRLAELLY